MTDPFLALSLKGNPFINGLARKFINNINTDFVTVTIWIFDS